MCYIGRLGTWRLRDELTGGLVSAAVAIPLAMGYGMFAFGPLGDDYFSYGALAGLYAAVVAGIVCVALGDRTTTIYAPRVTTTFFLGALLYYLVNSNAVLSRGGTHLVVLAFFAIILLGGLCQAFFGLIRLGSLLRFTPHPVMAGLQNAAAGLLFLVQLGNVCGFDRSIPFMAVPTHLNDVKPLSLVIALATFLAMWNARVIAKGIPPLVVGLGIGTALYFLVVAAGYGSHVGPVIGLPGTQPSPVPLNYIRDLTGTGPVYELLPLIVGGAFALAVVASLDALLCAKLVTPLSAPRASGDSLLIRLGLSNCLAACFGGITSGINIGPSVANRTFGATTSISVLINAAAVLAVIVVLFPVVSYTPRVVLSAAIMVIAVQHIDPWSIDLVRRIRTSASGSRGVMLVDLGVVAINESLNDELPLAAAVRHYGFYDVSSSDHAHSIPRASNRNAYSKAHSRRNAYRSESPPWPASK